MRTWDLMSPCFRCASTYRPDPVVGPKGLAPVSVLVSFGTVRHPSAGSRGRSLAPGRTAGTIRDNAWHSLTAQQICSRCPGIAGEALMRGQSDPPGGVGLDYCEVRNSRISARPR